MPRPLPPIITRVYVDCGVDGRIVVTSTLNAAAAAAACQQQAGDARCFRRCSTAAVTAFVVEQTCKVL